MKQNTTYKELEKVLKDFMKEKKLRKTMERFTILKQIYLMETKHFDVDTLHFFILKNGLRISKATLYNNINILIKAQILIRLDIEYKNNAQVYEKGYASQQHDHVICLSCGEITEFCDPRIEQIKESVQAYSNIQIKKHSLNFYGECGTPNGCKNPSTR